MPTTFPHEAESGAEGQPARKEVMPNDAHDELPVSKVQPNSICDLPGADASDKHADKREGQPPTPEPPPSNFLKIDPPGKMILDHPNFKEWERVGQKPDGLWLHYSNVVTLMGKWADHRLAEQSAEIERLREERDRVIGATSQLEDEVNLWCRKFTQSDVEAAGLRQENQRLKEALRRKGGGK